MEGASPERFQVAVGPIGPSCPHMMHFSENDGMEEKSFCIPDSFGSHHDECHIFSIGSNDQWGFETNVRKDIPHCHTHTFDCTLSGSPKHQPNDEMVHFYPFCVSSDKGKPDSATRESERNYLSYIDLWRGASIQRPPKLLKMDVEGFEFDVLTSMLASFENSHWWPEQVRLLICVVCNGK
jgi:hypothetical protein